MKIKIIGLILLAIFILIFFWVKYNYNQDYYILLNPNDLEYLVSQHGRWRNGAHKFQHLRHLRRLSNPNQWEYFKKLGYSEIDVDSYKNSNSPFADFSKYYMKYNPDKVFSSGAFYFIVKDDHIIYIGFRYKAS